jgi:hypothetical protein
MYMFVNAKMILVETSRNRRRGDEGDQWRG